MKPLAIIATIGAREHGKTTLTAAIAHLLAPDSDVIDPMPREGYRVEIAPPHYEYESEVRRYLHIDAAAHEEALSRPDRPVDGAILVVSVVEGVVESTRQALWAARGLPLFVVALTHVDAVDDPELIDVVELEVRGMFNALGLDGNDVPIVRVQALPSAPQHRASVLELVRTCDARLPQRIDRSI